MSGPKEWKPIEGDELKGTFHREDLNGGVKADDGTFWLLPLPASEQLKVLDLDEGDRVVVAYRGLDLADRAIFHVASA